MSVIRVEAMVDIEDVLTQISINDMFEHFSEKEILDEVESETLIEYCITEFGLLKPRDEE